MLTLTYSSQIILLTYYIIKDTILSNIYFELRGVVTLLIFKICNFEIYCRNKIFKKIYISITLRLIYVFKIIIPGNFQNISKSI